MNVIALQYDIAWEDKPANFATARRLLHAADPAPGSLVVLPELFATGFSMNTEEIAESYGGETERFLAELARAHQVCVIAGAALRGRDGRVRNKALAFSPDGRMLGFYAKMRPFSPGGEADHFTAGEAPAKVDFAGWSISPFICYDLRFPELFRAAAAAWQPGLYVVIANWPEKRIQHWARLLQARAIENQAYVVGVNRVGSDPSYAYGGHSLIVDPQGDILLEAGSLEGCIQTQLDLERLRKYRAGLPFLTDMKPITVGSVAKSAG